MFTAPAFSPFNGNYSAAYDTIPDAALSSPYILIVPVAFGQIFCV